MKKLALFLMLWAVPAMAQQTISIPAVPAQTYTVDTCTYVPATGILTINGVQVSALSLTQLSLTGGTSYPNGTYNVSMTAGVATLVPVSVVPPTPTPTGKTYTVTVPKTTGTSWTLVPSLTLAAGQQATVVAVSTHAGPPVPLVIGGTATAPTYTGDWFYYSPLRIQTDNTGAVFVGFSNTQASNPGGTVQVVVQ